MTTKTGKGNPEVSKSDQEAVQDNNIDIGLLDMAPLLQSKEVEGRAYLFDPVRRKWIVNTPEEWVRQLLILWLVHRKGVGTSRIAVEKKVRSSSTLDRFDLGVYTTSGNPVMLIECKSFKTKLDLKAINQLSRYNLKFKSSYLTWTNGRSTYCVAWNPSKQVYEFISEFPETI